MYLNQLSYNDGEAIRRDALRRCRVSAVNGQPAVGPRGAWRGESEPKRQRHACRVRGSPVHGSTRGHCAWQTCPRAASGHLTVLLRRRAARPDDFAF